MKLFTIGDSLSQGFMSGAAAQTGSCYSTLIAEILGLEMHGTGYRFPHWPHGGLPINIETILRRLNRVYGPNIRGAEWVGVPSEINIVLDRVEDYYERGDGSEDSPYRAPSKHGGYEPDYFHNVGSFGFDIADSWSLTGEVCLQEIATSEDVWFEDAFLGPPSASFYRSALQVLNPSRAVEHNDKSQIDWLRTHAENGGVENLILWLGNNNVLGTALDLNLNETPNSAARRPFRLSHVERKEAGWNMWHPEDFEDEYNTLIDKVVEIIIQFGSPEKIFVGNVPHVTILPLIKGIGEAEPHTNGRIYYRAYTYFPFDRKFAKRSGRFITRQEAIKIDKYIDQYNKSIKNILKAANKRLKNVKSSSRFFQIDFNQMLAEAAYKRNGGSPTYNFPDYIRQLQKKYAANNKLLSTHYYSVDRGGNFERGGFFSLDGVHPSVIGQGLLAHEILKTMEGACVTDVSGQLISTNDLDWRRIHAEDTLLARPIEIMPELYEHEKLSAFVGQIFSVLGKGPRRKFDM